MSRTRRARFTLEALGEVIPTPETELRYETPYQLIVAVILSAQCTDDRVNRTTPAFFEAFPTVEALADAEVDEVYPLIKSVTFPNNKSKHLVGMARRITREYGGKIPDSQKSLMTLPGVGRKTAQVVLSVAFGVDALPVDTHVFRVANRIGLVKSGADTPGKVEIQLKRIIPRDEWGVAHHLLILHGRYTCTARNPECDACPLTPVCVYYRRLQALPEPLHSLERAKGTYYCRTCDRYFDEATAHRGRRGVNQTACSSCGSMNVFRTKTGETAKKVKDYRV